MMPPQHLGQYQATAEAAGKPLPIAMVVGAPPSLMVAASSKIPLDASEIDVAGGWQGASLEMVPAVTVPVMVPANAEYVIEGEVLPDKREIEGPFGEFTDTYVDPAPNHVLRVTAITRRRDAIYHAMLAGGAEDITLLGLNLQIEVLKRVKAFAQITDISTPGHIFGCVVSIKKANDEQPRAVLMAALAAHSWMKVVVVVDDDVNIHDLREVMWAIHTRSTPDTGLYHLPRMGSFPRADVRAVHKGKFGIDATVPMDMRDAFVRRSFPQMDEIDLSDYID
jgi:UbiD family decarboxylase